MFVIPHTNWFSPQPLSITNASYENCLFGREQTAEFAEFPVIIEVLSYLSINTVNILRQETPCIHRR